MSRLVISFSGGETSARMAILLLGDPEVRAKYPEIVITFANTGQENERTLWFVEMCARLYFDVPVVWVEADLSGPKGVRARVVDYTTASRDGRPFEDAIRRYGIPNAKFPNCTRALKQHAMQAYLRSIGWAAGTYDTAIGIRADEFDRMSSLAATHRLVYPLCVRWPLTKPDINRFWQSQPFRLGLKGYQGNCKWCWKKSFRKHMTILHETPEAYDFPERMEQQYALVGPEFRKDPAPSPGYRRTFFRSNKSVQDLRAMLAEEIAKGTYSAARDDAAWTDPTIDGSEGGCGESCEVFSDDNLRESGT